MPKSVQNLVLSHAHEVTLAGYAGYNKSLHRVQSQFSSSSMIVDVRNHTKSCHVCQMEAPMGRHESALFLRMALIEERFQRAVIHLVGPLPVTKDGLDYILTRVGLTTRLAEATPLCKLTAEKIAEALFNLST